MVTKTFGKLLLTSAILASAGLASAEQVKIKITGTGTVQTGNSYENKPFTFTFSYDTNQSPTQSAGFYSKYSLSDYSFEIGGTPVTINPPNIDIHGGSPNFMNVYFAGEGSSTWGLFLGGNVRSTDLPGTDGFMNIVNGATSRGFYFNDVNNGIGISTSSFVVTNLPEPGGAWMFAAGLIVLPAARKYVRRRQPLVARTARSAALETPMAA